MNLQHSPTPVSVNTEDNDIPFAGDSSDEDDSNITSAFAFGSSSARTSIPTADSKVSDEDANNWSYYLLSTTTICHLWRK